MVVGGDEPKPATAHGRVRGFMALGASHGDSLTS